MIEKMSLEQFQQIRNQLAQLVKEYKDNYEAQLVKEYEDNYEAHKNGENYDDSVEEQRLVDQYLEIQNRLLQYDLSDIPFEEWKGLEIITGEKINFSKSHANLDFALLEAGSINNYHGCKVKNIHMLDKYFDESSFDQEYLLNTTIPTLIRYKYYLNKVCQHSCCL